MSRRLRRLAAVLALCVVASMSFGVGGFSSVDGDRNVSVSVVEKEDAYLGVETLAAGSCGNRDRLAVTNRLTTTLDRFDVVVEDIDGDVSAMVMETPSELDPGERGYVGVRVTPDGQQNGTKTVTLGIEATGSAVAVSTTASFDTYCAPSEEEDGEEENGDGEAGTQSQETDGNDGDADNGDDGGDNGTENADGSDSGDGGDNGNDGGGDSDG